jgi:hypothetical protein
MKNRPNQVNQDTIIEKIVAEALSISKVKNCRMFSGGHILKSYHCTINRGGKGVLVILEDNVIRVYLGQLVIDSRIGAKYWDEFKTMENNEITIQLADPDSITRLARIFRAIKPCWW